MDTLSPKKIRIKVRNLTPMHIHNNEILDRMDYFTFEWWDVIQIFDRKWLNFCAKKDRWLFDEIIENIETWDFITLEDNKYEFYEKFWDEFIKQYWIKNEIKIWEKASNLINQNNDYSTNKNQNWNQWEIKRFSRFWLNKELFIPWSTLKGIFRTIFLNDEIKKLNWYYKDQAKLLEKFENEDLFKKDLFAFLQFEDAKIINSKIEIQQINSKNKPVKQWQAPKKGISQILELVVWCEFEIIINDLQWQIDIEKLKIMIKDYSTSLIAREEQIINNINFDDKIIDDLDKNYNKDIFPIKIWMFKKSLSYKLFWEDMISELNKNFIWEKWLKESRKLWIWDKMLYIDEDNNPIWWILLSDIEIIDN